MLTFYYNARTQTGIASTLDGCDTITWFAATRAEFNQRVNNAYFILWCAGRIAV